MKISLISLKTAIAVLVLSCFVGQSGSTQSLLINKYVNSSNSSFCPLPAHIEINSGTCQFGGYTGNLDSITLVVYWGDGQTDTIKEAFSGFYNNFSFDESHDYEIPGQFDILIDAISPTYTSSYGVNTPLPIFLSPSCTDVSGTVYIDSIENCSQDSLDPLAKNVTIEFKDSNDALIGIGFSDFNGEYSASLPSNLESIRSSINSSFVGLICPENGHLFNTYTDTTLNFGVEKAGINDIQVWHSITGSGAPGEAGLVSFLVYAEGYDEGQIKVILTVDEQLDLSSQLVGVSPDSIVGNTVFWTVDYPTAPISSGRRRLLKVQFRTFTKTTAILNSKTHFQVTVENSVTETYTHNNEDKWYVRVGGPYDPNNKLVSPQGLHDQGKITVDQNLLTYTVNFQNTGSAPAKNVFIIDSLSDLFDHSTIQFLESSDPMKPSYYSNGVLRIDFEDINLPDSASDPAGSIGWFTFSIQLKDSLPLGTQIQNNVDIYFDYNASIRTNTTLNTLYEPPYVPIALDISTHGQDVTCINHENGSAEVNINTSELPYSILWSNGANTASIKNLSTGLYFVTVSDTFGQSAIVSVLIEENRIHDDPLVGTISGTLEVQSWKPFIYTVPTGGNSTFDWSANGGEIVQATANTAQVLWNAGPIGTLTVEETDVNGCTGSNDLEVAIQFVGIDETETKNFSLYPNPTNGLVQVQLNELNGSDKIEILDMQGRVVLNQQISNSSTQFDLSELSSGTYTVRLSSDLEITEKSLIKR